MKVKVTQLCPTLCNPMSQVHGILQTRILEWVVVSFSWGIFPTQGSNPGLLHCGWILFQLNHQGSPGILEWVDYPFCSGTSRPRSQTGVSCIAGRFFTSWATREDPMNVGVGHKHSDHCRWEEQGFSFCQWPSCVSIRDVIVKDQANSWTGLE